MSYDKKEATSYADNLIACIVPNDFNFAPPELKEEHKNFVKNWADKNLKYENLSEEEIAFKENQYNFIKDFGKYCAIKGYDSYISQ